MQPLAEKQLAAGCPGEGVDVLVGVARAESSKQDFHLVSFSVPGRVPHMDQVTTVPNVCSAMAERESSRHV